MQGDGQALRRDLAQFLGLEEKLVRVKVPTGHLEVDVSFVLHFLFATTICERGGKYDTRKGAGRWNRNRERDGKWGREARKGEEEDR